MYKNDFSENVTFSGFCKVGSSYIVYAYSNTETDASIKVPSELVGKEIDTLLYKNAECSTSLVSTDIDISFSGEGYILLKLS